MEKIKIPIWSIRFKVVLIVMVVFFFTVGLVKRCHAFNSNPNTFAFCVVAPFSGSYQGFWYWRCFTNTELSNIVTSLCTLHSGCNNITGGYVYNFFAPDAAYANSGDMGAICISYSGVGCGGSNSTNLSSYQFADNSTLVNFQNEINAASNGTLSVEFPWQNGEAVIMNSYNTLNSAYTKCVAACNTSTNYTGYANCGGNSGCGYGGFNCTCATCTGAGYAGKTPICWASVPTLNGGAYDYFTSSANSGSACGFGVSGSACATTAPSGYCASYCAGLGDPSPTTANVSNDIVDNRASQMGGAVSRDVVSGTIVNGNQTGASNTVNVTPSVQGTAGIGGNQSEAGAGAAGAANSNAGATNSTSGGVGGGSSPSAADIGAAAANAEKGLFVAVSPNASYLAGTNVPSNYRITPSSDVGSSFTTQMNTAFTTFKTNMGSTTLFSSVTGFFNAAPTTGTWSPITINGGATFGTATFDPGSYWNTPLTILKGAFILCCVYIGIRIVTKGGA